MLSNALILSLIVYFIHVCIYWEGMIFEKVGDAINENISEWISKPWLFACPICSTPWWGGWFYGLMYLTGVTGFETVHWVTIIATLFTASGIAVLLVIASKFFSVLKLMEEKYEQGEGNII